MASELADEFLDWWIQVGLVEHVRKVGGIDLYALTEKGYRVASGLVGIEEIEDRSQPALHRDREWEFGVRVNQQLAPDRKWMRELDKGIEKDGR